MHVHNRFSQEAKASLLHILVQNTGASRGHRQGSARLAWAWLEARVQHSLTLLTELRQLDTLMPGPWEEGTAG